LGQQSEDLSFPFGQLRKGDRDRAGGQRAGEERRDAAGDLRAEQGLSAGGGEDGAVDGFAVGLFQQVAAGAGAEGGEDRVFVLVHGEHHDGNARVGGTDPGGGGEAADAGHPQIHEHHVGTVFGDCGDGSGAVSGFGDDGDAVQFGERRWRGRSGGRRPG
jgi:hypothetical protein